MAPAPPDTAGITLLASVQNKVIFSADTEYNNGIEVQWF